MTTATAFTISHTVDQDIIDDLENEFDTFRGRIALLSIEACGTLTGMFSPMAPAELDVIDIEELEQFELQFDTTPVAQETIVLPFVAA